MTSTPAELPALETAEASDVLAVAQADATGAQTGVAAAAGEATSVTHLAAEYWPFARTGGLAEAVRGLADHQAAEGTPITVFMPLYRRVREDGWAIKEALPPFTVRVGSRNDTAHLFALVEPGVTGPRVFFVDHAEYFDRAGIYGDGSGDYADNGRRFAFYCLAALKALPRLVPTQTILHCHDWHTALAPVYLRARHGGRDYYDQTGAVVTVHNAGFQGHFPSSSLADLGLPESLYTVEHLEWYGRVNWLKGGLTFADVATTVSPTHAGELKTPEGGFGLHEAFTALGDRFVGIVNGIDLSLWDPAHDDDIPERFSIVNLDGKKRCKEAFQRAHDLTVDARAPLIGMTARLAAQKGFDLLLDGKWLTATDAQFVVLGEGEQKYRDGLRQIADLLPGRVATIFEFSEHVEHQLLAAADFLLMPSLYEPCGLTQMRAQRYGALPIARRVGGLADTIVDSVTGFLFDEYTPAALAQAVQRALAQYADAIEWRKRQREAMRQDFGWRPSATKYQEAYRRVAAVRGHIQRD